MNRPHVKTDQGEDTAPLRLSPHRVGVAFSMRLPRWQRWSLYGVGFAVAVSGVSWLVLELTDAAEDPLSQWRDVQHSIAIAHGTAALIGVALLGSLVPVHARLGWRFKRNIATGLTLGIAMLLVSLTGGALYYTSEGLWRAISGWTHEIVGVGSVALFIAHWLARTRE